MTNENTLLLKGIAASAGIYSGIARIFYDPVQAVNEIEEGNILVTSMTEPSWLIAMAKSKAIVTNSGGALSHAAIVAREFGIPCVVGTRTATETIKDGMRITVDGSKGLIFLAKD